jgi:hypothetical protein
MEREVQRLHHHVRVAMLDDRDNKTSFHEKVVKSQGERHSALEEGVAGQNGSQRDDPLLIRFHLTASQARIISLLTFEIIIFGNRIH